MDLLGIAALGGLERITIVAGAVIIGYWGYRLYTAEKNAGLVFMGLAVLVLVGALATGTGHLKRVSEDYQLASIPPAEAEPAAGTPFAQSPAASPLPVSDADLTAPETPAPAAAETATERPTAATPSAPDEATASASAPAAPDPAPEVAAHTELPPAPESPASPVRRLATGQELGGRIVSVKSENVSLEWTPEPESN